MITFQQHKAEALAKDPVLKKAYDDLEVEYALIGKLIEYRRKEGITQVELARRMGTKQSAISRFESGTENPTLDFLRRLAEAIGAKITVTVS